MKADPHITARSAVNCQPRSPSKAKEGFPRATSMTILALLLAPSSLGLHHSPLLRQSRVVQRSGASAPARMIALDPLVASDMNERFDLPLLSGLQGKAMLTHAAIKTNGVDAKVQPRRAPSPCLYGVPLYL